MEQNSHLTSFEKESGTATVQLMESDGDDEAVRRVREGDRDAYAVIVRRYEAPIRRFCHRMLGEPHRAEDAAQEAFHAAFLRIDTFRGDSSFKTWLFRIALNRCRDMLRYSARRSTESWEAIVEHGGHAAEALAAVEAPGYAAVEARDVLKRVLQSLPPEYREVLLLRELDDQSYQEMAETLECSVDAVKGRLKRARAALDGALRHLCEESTVRRSEEREQS